MNKELKDKSLKELLDEAESIMNSEQKNINEEIKEIKKICEKDLLREEQTRKNNSPLGYVKPRVNKK